jgi:DNA-binding beta-propeller fold protein YncE
VLAEGVRVKPKVAGDVCKKTSRVKSGKSVRDHLFGTLILLVGALLVAGSDISGAALLVTPDIGRIYVVDITGQIARVDDMTGAGRIALGTEGAGVKQFHAPRGIFVDKAGQIYVADLFNGRIVEMRDMTGASWNSLGGFTPTGIFVDEAGRIYVVDGGNDRVVRINDISGSGDWIILSGQFEPSGIFLDEAGRIYITDSYNDRVVRFNDMKGVGRVTLGTKGPGVKQFNLPEGIFVDRVGRIYVADWLNERIVRMNDMTGAGWTTLSTCPQPPGCPGGNQPLSPRGIFVDGAGRIYVADSNNGRIVRVDDMTGAGWTTLAWPGHPEGIFVR